MRDSKTGLSLPTSGGRSSARRGSVHDSSGELIGRIIVLREITAAQHSAELLKSELVATVSHEVRTPLAGILGFAELLLHRQTDEDTRRSYLETVHGEAVRLTALIDDFLDLQKIEAGHFPLNSEPFDPRARTPERSGALLNAVRHPSTRLHRLARTTSGRRAIIVRSAAS